MITGRDLREVQVLSGDGDGVLAGITGFSGPTRFAVFAEELTAKAKRRSINDLSRCKNTLAVSQTWSLRIKGIDLL